MKSDREIRPPAQRLEVMTIFGLRALAPQGGFTPGLLTAQVTTYNQFPGTLEALMVIESVGTLLGCTVYEEAGRGQVPPETGAAITASVLPFCHWKLTPALPVIPKHTLTAILFSL